MSQLILINGNPGVGKSTLINLLKDRYLSATFFSKDDFKEQVLDKIISDSIPQKSQIAGKLAMQFGFNLAKTMLSNKQQVFFESNFHPEFALEDLKQFTKTQIKQIYLHCSDQTAFERFQARLKDSKRHAIHTQADSQIITLEHYLHKLKRDPIPGVQTLQVSTEQPFKITEILDFIDN